MLCNLCKKDKEEDLFEFRKDRGSYRKTCKECRNERERSKYPLKAKELSEKRKVVRAKNLDECNEKARIRYWAKRDDLLQKAKKRPSYRNRSSDSFKKWRTKNKHKCAAQQAVTRAIKNGKLIRPEKCCICARIEKLNAHHSDYSKPIDVIWVCVPCHRKLHSKFFKCNVPKRNLKEET